MLGVSVQEEKKQCSIACRVAHTARFGEAKRDRILRLELFDICGDGGLGNGRSGESWVVDTKVETTQLGKC